MFIGLHSVLAQAESENISANVISKRIVALREQVEFAKQKLDSNDANKVELERIRKILLDQRIAFYEYDDVTVRLLVEYIKVMSDGKIVIVLKGGEEIEERL